MSIPQSDADKLLRPLPHFGAAAAAEKPPVREFALHSEDGAVEPIDAHDYYLAEGFVVFRDVKGNPIRAITLDGIIEIETVRVIA